MSVQILPKLKNAKSMNCCLCDQHCNPSWGWRNMGLFALNQKGRERSCPSPPWQEGGSIFNFFLSLLHSIYSLQREVLVDTGFLRPSQSFSIKHRGKPFFPLQKQWYKTLCFQEHKAPHFVYRKLICKRLSKSFEWLSSQWSLRQNVHLGFVLAIFYVNFHLVLLIEKHLEEKWDPTDPTRT